MDKHYIILEVQEQYVWFANATSTEGPVRYDAKEVLREVESFREARPVSRFIIVNIEL